MDIKRLLLNIISFVALSVLFVPCSIKMILLYIVVSGTLGFLYTKYVNRCKYHLLIVVLCVLYSISLAMSFKTKWIFFEGINIITGIIGMDNGMFLYIAGAVIAIFAFPALLNISEFIYAKLSEKAIIPDKAETKINYLLIFFFAFVIVTLSTTCSFLYKYHSWGDSNIFFTIGKSMLSGIMPYRDLFDQKGPVVFMMHALAALISYKSFFGVYVLQLINGFVFLLFVYKTNCLLFKKNNYLNTLLLGVLTYTSVAYSIGDSAEEFSLAILMYAIYVAVKHSLANTVPSKFEFIMIGITSGLIFWMKYTIIGFYLGWILIPAYIEIKNKNIKRLFTNIAYIVLGVIITTAPIFICFGMNGCLDIMLKSYFLENMVSYSGDNLGIFGSIYNIFFHGLTSILESNLILFVFAIYGLCKLSSLNKLQASVVSMFLAMVFTVYFGGRYMFYYCLVLSPFALFGISYFVNTLDDVMAFKFNVKFRNIIYVTVTVLIFVLCNNSIKEINKPYEEYLEYNVIKDIEASGLEEPTILYYNALEKGFQNYMGYVPKVKYYFVPNLMQEKLTPIQDEYIEDGLVDFVFTKIDKEYPGYSLVNCYQDKYYLFIKE